MVALAKAVATASLLCGGVAAYYGHPDKDGKCKENEENAAVPAGLFGHSCYPKCDEGGKQGWWGGKECPPGYGSLGKCGFHIGDQWKPKTPLCYLSCYISEHTFAKCPSDPEFGDSQCIGIGKTAAGDLEYACIYVAASDSEMNNTVVV